MVQNPKNVNNARNVILDVADEKGWNDMKLLDNMILWFDSKPESLQNLIEFLNTQKVDVNFISEPLTKDGKANPNWD